jgi:hypothetical protein
MKKKNSWVKWFKRLGIFYDQGFEGKEWREKPRYLWQEQLKSISPNL